MGGNIKNYKKVVAYWETDQMGIVHHSNYVKWMEEARLHFLREIDLPYEYIEHEKYMLPVYKVEVIYKKPARFADRIEIKTSIYELTNVKIGLKYEIFNDKNQIIATGKTLHPFTDMDLKIKKMPLKFYEHFNKFFITEEIN